MTAQPSIPEPRKSLGDEMLTLDETAALLRVPENTLRYWARDRCRPEELQGRPPRPLLEGRRRPLAHGADEPPTAPLNRSAPVGGRAHHEDLSEGDSHGLGLEGNANPGAGRTATKLASSTPSRSKGRSTRSAGSPPRSRRSSAVTG